MKEAITYCGSYSRCLRRTASRSPHPASPRNPCPICPSPWRLRVVSHVQCSVLQSGLVSSHSVRKHIRTALGSFQQTFSFELELPDIYIRRIVYMLCDLVSSKLQCMHMIKIINGTLNEKDERIICCAHETRPWYDADSFEMLGCLAHVFEPALFAHLGVMRAWQHHTKCFVLSDKRSWDGHIITNVMENYVIVTWHSLQAGMHATILRSFNTSHIDFYHYNWLLRMRSLRLSRRHLIFLDLVIYLPNWWSFWPWVKCTAIAAIVLMRKQTLRIRIIIKR